MTENLEKELEELRQQRNDLHAQLQRKGREVADLKRRICDELYTYPAYALLETLKFICKVKGAENASNAH